MTSVCVSLLIIGQVQGVSYRFAAQQAAMKLHLVGSVQNKSNGDVEVIAEGQQQDINQFIEWARRGPKYADVKQVIVQNVTAQGKLTQFNIR
jgi:acylphosphatase